MQWDERWGYAPYGTSIVAASGCGPTCMAMVAAGLNQDASITPAKVAAYGTEHGYGTKRITRTGDSWMKPEQTGILTVLQVFCQRSR